jgi:hypothetical protein
MGTDESTIESERFVCVRGRLSAPETGGVGPSGLRERVPSLAIEGVESVQCRKLRDVAGTLPSLPDRMGGEAA